MTKETNSLFHLLTKGDYSRVNQDIFELVLYLFVIPMTLFYGVPKAWVIIKKCLKTRSDRKVAQEKYWTQFQEVIKESQRLAEIGKRYTDFCADGSIWTAQLEASSLATASLNEIRAGLILELVTLCEAEELKESQKRECIVLTKGLWSKVPFFEVISKRSKSEIEKTDSILWAESVWNDFMEFLPPSKNLSEIDSPIIRESIVKRLLVGIPLDS